MSTNVILHTASQSSLPQNHTTEASETLRQVAESADTLGIKLVKIANEKKPDETDQLLSEQLQAAEFLDPFAKEFVAGTEEYKTRGSLDFHLTVLDNAKKPDDQEYDSDSVQTMHCTKQRKQAIAEAQRKTEERSCKRELCCLITCAASLVIGGTIAAYYAQNG